MQTVTTNDVLDSFPRQFFVEFPREVLSRYESAHQAVENQLPGRPLSSWMRGLQYYPAREEASRAAAITCGIESSDWRVGGHSVVVISSGRFDVMEVRVPAWKEFPKLRPGKRALVEGNPVHGIQHGQLRMMLREASGQVGSSCRLFGFLVVVDPKRGEHEPQNIGFAVPTGDMDGWLFIEPLDVLLAAYGDKEKQSQPPTRPVVPKLRPRRRSEEPFGEESESDG